MKKNTTIFIVTLSIALFFAGTAYAENALPTQGGTASNALLGGDQYAPTSSSYEQSRPATQAEVQAELNKSIQKTAVAPNSQAAAYDSKSQTNNGTSIGYKQAAAGSIGCLGGQILGNIVSGLITSAIGSVVSGVVDAVTNVPVAEKGQVLINSKTDSSAHTGTSIGAFGISSLALPSWDAVAYCVVNAMIDYVANSTIAWVQGGFQGNPSFVNNPEEFFRGMANVEAGAFLKELAYGATGVNICQPFRAQIVLSIARNQIGSQQGYGGANGYSNGGFGGNGSGGGYGGCTLDQMKGNLNGFLKGDFQQGGWSNWFQLTQVNSNNPYATYFSLQAQLDGAINKKQNLAQAELNWGNGFLSFRKCDTNTPKDKQGNCPITSPGVVIQGQLEKTLGLPKDRLVLAQKFDQVIGAVVNQLINVALDKVLESSSK